MLRRLALALAVCTLVATRAQSQDLDLKEILAGTVAPVTMNLKDLDSAWRRVGVGGSDSSNPIGALAALYGGGGGGSSFYTLGRTVKIGDETYIVAYRAASKPIDIMAMSRMSEPPKPEKLKPDTKLWLCLLNVRTSGSIMDIRAFDLATEIKESSGAADGVTGALDTAHDSAVTTSSQSNMKQLALGILMYSQDYDEVLPPMKTAAELKKAIMPYVKNEAVFVHPQTKAPYMPNPILTNKPMRKIANPAQFVLLYEPAASNGKRCVAFADGHTKVIQESEWPRLKKACKIP